MRSKKTISAADILDDVRSTEMEKKTTENNGNNDINSYIALISEGPKDMMQCTVDRKVKDELEIYLKAGGFECPMNVMISAIIKKYLVENREVTQKFLRSFF